CPPQFAASNRRPNFSRKWPTRHRSRHSTSSCAPPPRTALRSPPRLIDFRSAPSRRRAVSSSSRGPSRPRRRRSARVFARYRWWTPVTSRRSSRSYARRSKRLRRRQNKVKMTRRMNSFSERVLATRSPKQKRKATIEVAKLARGAHQRAIVERGVWAGSRRRIRVVLLLGLLRRRLLPLVVLVGLGGLGFRGRLREGDLLRLQRLQHPVRVGFRHVLCDDLLRALGFRELGRVPGAAGGALGAAPFAHRTIFTLG